MSKDFKDLWENTGSPWWFSTGLLLLYFFLATRMNNPWLFALYADLILLGNILGILSGIATVKILRKKLTPEPSSDSIL